MTLKPLTEADGAAPQNAAAAGDGLALGIDTGGTFTDAVLLADGRHVIATAKALTTHWDLAIGIGNAIRAVLAEPTAVAEPRR